MYCKTCGAEILDGAVVCPKCGVPTNPSSVTNGSAVATEKAPNSISGFVFGLLGFMLDWFPIVGFILSIVGVSLCSKGKKAILMHPGRYTGSGFLTAGQVLGIIGLVVSSFVLLATIIWGIVLGEGFWFFLEILDL